MKRDGQSRLRNPDPWTTPRASRLRGPSQEFSEQFGPSSHKRKDFSRNSPQKVHPNFAGNLGREILGNTFSGLNLC